jgi:hypothetical protein
MGRYTVSVRFMYPDSTFGEMVLAFDVDSRATRRHILAELQPIVTDKVGRPITHLEIVRENDPFDIAWLEAAQEVGQ